MKYEDLVFAVPEVENIIQLDILNPETQEKETIDLPVRVYLPMEEKSSFIADVVSCSLDAATGTFSPIRVEIYFSLNLCRYYAGIEFPEDEGVGKIYDNMELSGILDKITQAIPQDEYEFLKELTLDTIDDIARFNSSAAGIISNMSTDAEGLNGQITEILEKIKNKEGVEYLSNLRDIMLNEETKKPIVVRKN